MSNGSHGVVTQLPTMCNVDKLSEDQLKEEVLRQQDEIFKLGSALHEVNAIAFNQASIIDRLVVAHKAGDAVLIASSLEVLAKHRDQQIAAGQRPAKNH